MRTATTAPFALFALFTFALAAPCAQAQAIYRCGNSYGQKPCEGATVVEGAAPAPAGAASLARKENERQARAADAMEAARLKAEGKPVAAYIPPEPKPQKIEPHRPEVFVAKSPASKPKAKAGAKKKKAKDAAA